MSSNKRSKSDPALSFRGFGKLILFGEHFVVYNKPAFVGAVEAFTDCQVTLSDENTWSTGLIVEDGRPAVPNYKDTKCDEMLESTELVLKHLGFDSKRRGIKIQLGGSLCAVSGIGASAANCVALARALSNAMGKTMTEDEINATAYEGEKGYHGTPSGIDNTASTFGGVLRFQRTDAEPLFETRKLDKACLIVYASTGITASTTTVVGDVRARRESDRAWYDALETRYVEMFNKADKALNECDFETIGKLANENHKLLQELGVSCAELDALVNAALAAGAIGAKMSGTGRGGLAFAICKDQESQDAVFNALSKIAPQGQCWKTSFK